MMIRCRFLAATTLLSLATAQHCHHIGADSSCPQGCWHESGIVHSDGSRKCEPVGPGHYSPRNDNLRSPCSMGTFSNIDAAELCVSCPAGTHASSAGLSECRVCPAGTYSGIPGSAYCTLCDPTHYDREGANSVQVWNGIVYCVLSSLESTTMTGTSAPAMAPTKSPTTMAPTSVPSLAPSTKAPTSAPSMAPMTPPTTTMAPTSTSSMPLMVSLTLTAPTSAPSTATSEQASNIPTMATSDANITYDLNETLPLDMPSSSMVYCEDDEFEWHGKCTQCPSTTRELLHPLWIVFFVASVIALLHYLPSCCNAILWMGLEYLQLLYLLGITPVPWTPILERLHGILSIFALDLDSSFSLQCMLGISPQAERVWILLVPLLVWMTFLVLSKVYREMPKTTGWTAIGLYMGYTKLVLTSMEALRCSSSSWFCHDHKIAAVIGIIGFVLYGGGFPLWLLYNLHKTTRDDKTNCPDWTRNFPFQSTCWWWTGFWILRKLLVVIIMVLFSHAPFVILTAFFIMLMLSEIVQRCCYSPPFPGEDYCEGKKKSVWFRNATVDMALQACFMGVTALSFIFLVVVPEDSRRRLAISILFLIVLIPSLVYWILALLHSHYSCSCRRHQESSTTTGTDTTTTMKTKKKKTKRSSKHNTIHRNLPSSSSSTTSESSSSMDVPNNHSMVPHTGSFPHTGSCEDRDYETGKEEYDDEESGWKETQDYENWLATGDSVVLSCLHRPSRRTTSSTTSDDSYDIEDDSQTITIMEYSAASPETCKTPIFEEEFDDEDDLETVYSSSDPEDDDDDDATLDEIWIDEATGLPIEDPNNGQWTDAETGLRAEYAGRQKEGMVLEPFHRVEPFTWGRRLSSVYRPEQHS